MWQSKKLPPGALRPRIFHPYSSAFDAAHSSSSDVDSGDDKKVADETDGSVMQGLARTRCSTFGSSRLVRCTDHGGRAARLACVVRSINSTSNHATCSRSLQGRSPAAVPAQASPSAPKQEPGPQSHRELAAESEAEATTTIQTQRFGHNTLLDMSLAAQAQSAGIAFTFDSSPSAGFSSVYELCPCCDAKRATMDVAQKQNTVHARAAEHIKSVPEPAASMSMSGRQETRHRFVLGHGDGEITLSYVPRLHDLGVDPHDGRSGSLSTTAMGAMALDASRSGLMHSWTLRTWQSERRIFLRLVRLPFFKNFRRMKYLRLWQREVWKRRQRRATALVERNILSHVCGGIFRKPLQRLLHLRHRIQSVPLVHVNVRREPSEGRQRKNSVCCEHTDRSAGVDGKDIAASTDDAATQDANDAGGAETKSIAEVDRTLTMQDFERYQMHQQRRAKTRLRLLCASAEEICAAACRTMLQQQGIDKAVATALFGEDIVSSDADDDIKHAERIQSQLQRQLVSLDIVTVEGDRRFRNLRRLSAFVRLADMILADALASCVASAMEAFAFAVGVPTSNNHPGAAVREPRKELSDKAGVLVPFRFMDTRARVPFLRVEIALESGGNGGGGELRILPRMSLWVGTIGQTIQKIASLVGSLPRLMMAPRLNAVSMCFGTAMERRGCRVAEHHSNFAAAMIEQDLDPTVSTQLEARILARSQLHIMMQTMRVRLDALGVQMEHYISQLQPVVDLLRGDGINLAISALDSNTGLLTSTDRSCGKSAMCTLLDGTMMGRKDQKDTSDLGQARDIRLLQMMAATTHKWRVTLKTTQQLRSAQQIGCFRVCRATLAETLVPLAQARLLQLERHVVHIAVRRALNVSMRCSALASLLLNVPLSRAQCLNWLDALNSMYKPSKAVKGSSQRTQAFARRKVGTSISSRWVSALHPRRAHLDAEVHRADALIAFVADTLKLEVPIDGNILPPPLEPPSLSQGRHKDEDHDEVGSEGCDGDGTRAALRTFRVSIQAMKFVAKLKHAVQRTRMEQGALHSKVKRKSSLYESAAPITFGRLRDELRKQLSALDRAAMEALTHKLDHMDHFNVDDEQEAKTDIYESV